MNNIEFTFLTEEQIFGDNQLDILKKYGTECAITDFAILLGGLSVSSCALLKESYEETILDAGGQSHLVEIMA